MQFIAGKRFLEVEGDLMANYYCFPCDYLLGNYALVQGYKITLPRRLYEMAVLDTGFLPMLAAIDVVLMLTPAGAEFMNTLNYDTQEF